MSDAGPKQSDDSTSSVSTFIGSVNDLSQQLEALGTPLAHELLREIATITAELKTWNEAPPPQQERVATIQRLLELNRRAMAYISAERAESLRPETRKPSGFLAKVIPRRWRK